MFTKIAIVVGVIVVVYVVKNLNTISGAAAREAVAGGALLLDVRTQGEFRGGHIDGALNIPVGSLPSRMDELGDRDVSIVVYCRSGARSGRAKRLLRAAGFTDVGNLGGMHRW